MTRFPVTLESQDDFDRLIKHRLDREKAKRARLQARIDALTADHKGRADLIDAALDARDAINGILSVIDPTTPKEN